MIKKCKILSIVIIISLFLSAIIPSIAAQTNKNDNTKLDEIGKIIDGVNKNSDYVYIIGKYAFTSVLNVPDIMVAARSIEVAEDEDVYEKMAIHCIKRTYDENFEPTGWEVIENVVGTNKLEIDKIDICYVDKVTVEKVKNDNVVDNNSSESLPQLDKELDKDPDVNLDEEQKDVPSEPEQTIPSEEKENTPSEPEQTIPSEEKENTPSEPEQTSPSEEKENTPSNPEQTIPSEEKENTPSEPEQTSPSEEQKDTPSEPEQTSPSEEQKDTPNNEKEPNLDEPQDNEPSEEVEHVHSFSDWEITLEPTCLSQGIETRRCETCSETETRPIINANAHKKVRATYLDKKATCTMIGMENSYKCEICGQEFFKLIPALGHNFDGEEVIDKVATCTEKGYKSLHCTREDCDERINVVEIPALGHKYEQTRTEQVTCTENGKIVDICSLCGYEKETIIQKALGHNFENYTYNNDATCVKNGTETAHCTRCDETSTREVPNSKVINHDYETISEEKATCTTEGKLVQRCKICNKEITKIIPKLSHDWKIEQYAKDGKYSCRGSIIKKTCENCNEEEISGGDFIYGTGHKWVEDENGRHYCEDCKFKEPIDEERIVWYVSFFADTLESGGFEGKELLIKSFIPNTVKYQKVAPQEKPGYRFVGWVDAATGNSVEDDILEDGTKRVQGRSITITWRDAYRTFKACYEKIEN